MNLYNLLKPCLFSIDPEKAHTLCLGALSFWHRVGGLKSVQIQDPTQVMGLEFANKIGLSAGFDKNGQYVDALAKLGFGFIEVGTVTPKPQSGHSKPRLFRLADQEALINRLGFNNRGVDFLVDKLRSVRYSGVLGVNIGKNKSTPLNDSIDDYRVCFQKVYPYASYVAVNISSPNTPGLRTLSGPEYFEDLMSALKTTQAQLADKHSRYVPLVVKISPDLQEMSVKRLADQLMAAQIDGVIATNTTVQRSLLPEDSPYASQSGGLSGRPLFHLSNRVITWLHAVLGSTIPIIGVGGVLSHEDVLAKISAGASLVQVYTGLIYRGPSWVKSLI